MCVCVFLSCDYYQQGVKVSACCLPQIELQDHSIDTFCFSLDDCDGNTEEHQRRGREACFSRQHRLGAITCALNACSLDVSDVSAVSVGF